MSRRNEELLRTGIFAVLGVGPSVLLGCGGATTSTGAGGSGAHGSATSNGGATANGGARPSGGATSIAGAPGAGGAFGLGGFVDSSGGVPNLSPTPIPDGPRRPAADAGWDVPDAGIFTVEITGFPSACPSYTSIESNLDPRVAADALCAPRTVEMSRVTYICLAAPPSGQGCDAYDVNCVATLYRCGLARQADTVCGPAVVHGTGACCYVLAGSCPVGRPLLVEGAARLAGSVRRRDWAASVTPDTDGLDAETRRALADAYTRDGLAEHASVAAFARFALECLALGAPAELVQAAQQAGLEEVAHAKLAFGLAGVYGGVAVGPGALDLRGVLAGRTDIADVAACVVREGCVAETVSALLIAGARDRAEDPAIRAALAVVAEEEHEHARLAWRFVRWALEFRGAAVRIAVTEAFAHAGDHVGFGAVTELRGRPDLMRAHGYLPVAERRVIAESALQNVVSPAASALLGLGAGSFAAVGA